MDGWTVIYSDSFPPAVELRRVILEEHHIPAVMLNKRDSSYLFGFVELRVQAKDVSRALAILESSAESDD